MIFYDITGFHRYDFFQIISMYQYLDDIRFSGKVSAHLIQHIKHDMRKSIVGKRFRALRRSGNVF